MLYLIRLYAVVQSMSVVRWKNDVSSFCVGLFGALNNYFVFANLSNLCAALGNLYVSLTFWDFLGPAGLSEERLGLKKDR